MIIDEILFCYLSMAYHIAQEHYHVLAYCNLYINVVVEDHGYYLVLTTILVVVVMS